MSVILDIAVIIIVVASTYIGARRGFIKTVMGLAAVVLALLAALQLSPSFVDKLNEKYVYDFTEKKVEKVLKSNEKNGELKISSIYNRMPKSAVSFLEKCGLIKGGVFDYYEDAKADPQKDAIHETAVYISKPISKLFSRVTAFALTFIVTFILLIIVLIIVNKICKLPGIRILNRGFGGIAGLLRGLIIAIVICAVLYHIVPIISGINGKITAETIEDTIIVRYLGSFKFISLF